MRVIVHIAPGPNWRKGHTVFEQGEPVEEHLAAMRAHFDAGRLLLGGPFLEPGRGGIAVLQVDDLPAAKTLMDADPAVRAGVMTYSLDKLTPIFDAFAGTRTVGSVADVAGTLS
jgi:uncharacterized protein YciI